MAIKFTNTEEATDYYKIILYGPTDAGKTTTIKTAPSPIIIDAEKKLLPLKGSNIPAISIDDFEDFKQAYEFLKTPKCDRFKTVVIDSGSKIAEDLLKYYIDNPPTPKGAPNLQASYGQTAIDMTEWMNKYLDLTKTHGKHIVFIMKAEMVNDEHLKMMLWYPSAPGSKFPQSIPYMFDMIFALRKGERKNPETGEVKRFRYFQTQGCLQWTAKGHNNLKDIEKPDFTHIFRKVLGENKKETETKQKQEKE